MIPVLSLTCLSREKWRVAHLSLTCRSLVTIMVL